MGRRLRHDGPAGRGGQVSYRGRSANLGRKLKLPPGWKCEVKTLEKNLTVVPPAPDFLAHAVSDEFQNIYAGCDFGHTCNYFHCSLA